MIDERRAMPLTIGHLERDGHLTLKLSGELDLSSAAELVSELPRCCKPDTSKISLDLGEVSFMDSTGLRALLTAAEICKRRGTELEVLGATGSVRRLLQLTGATHVLPIASADGMGAAGSDVAHHSWKATDGRTDAAR